MAKNKTRPRKGRPQGMTYADELARRRMIHEAAQEAAKDAAVMVRANTATQKALWLAVCSIADAYGFGPARMQKFFEAFQENIDELEHMREQNGEEYAYEKLRLKAERVTGVQIEYLYEKDAAAAALRNLENA